MRGSHSDPGKGVLSPLGCSCSWHSALPNPDHPAVTRAPHQRGSSHLKVDNPHFLNLHEGFCFAPQPWGGQEGVFDAVFVPIRCQQSSWS